MASERPNILFVMADQMAAPVLPFHSGPVVKAPNLARLAEDGVVFESAYCNSPLCAPSRFSMLSGQLPSQIAAYDNAAEFPAATPTFAHHLRLAGYRTLLSGKMHFVGPDQLHGFEERLTTDIYPADFGWTPNWAAGDAVQDYFHTMLSVVEAGPCTRSMQLDFDDEAAFQARRALFDLARSGDQRPFFLLVSFTHPHDPYTISREHWDRYSDSEINLPDVPAIPFESRDPHSQRLFRACGMDQYDLSDARIKNARRAYYGAISYVDDKLGELLQSLEACGLAEETLIIFTADHGDMLGERGSWYKMTFYEWAARVPLIVSFPRRYAPRRVTHNVSLLDLLPTLSDLAGGAAVATGDPLAGRSLVPLLAGDSVGWPDTAYGEYLGEGAAGPLVMIRRGANKYVVGEDSPPQLFDLAQDPRELMNLAESPEHAELAANFARLADETWDLEGLRAQVVADQSRRLLVDRALRTGRFTPWDYQPREDATRRYARNHVGVLEDIEGAARMPRAVTPPKDGPGRASGA